MAILSGGGIIQNGIFGYNNPILNKLGGYWKFENNLTDSSGNGLDGTTTSAAYAAGVVGQAYDFNTGHFISVPDSSLIDGDAGNITVSHWVKFTNISQRGATLSRQGDSANGWEFFVSGSIVQLIIGSNTIVYPFSGLTNNNWYHLAFTYNNSVCKIYIDGALAASENVSADISDDQSMYMGRERQNVNITIDGYIDEVAIWNRVLSDDEIEVIYSTQYIL